MSSLQKIVETRVIVTKKNGGKLKLKHRWTNTDGKEVKVDIELNIKKNSVSKDAEFVLSLDEEMFITAFDVSFYPHGILFLKDAELKIKAEGLNLDGVDEDSFGLYYDNNETGDWEMMEWKKLKIDKKKGKIELEKGKLPHFSRYAMAWSN